MPTHDIALRQLLNRLEEREKKQKVFIVTGAPGSGKTTYVRNNKRYGDIVIDLDLLAAALQGENNTHPNYEPVMDAVLAVRETLYETIENRVGRWNRAFIITSSADNGSIENLATRLDGEVIQMQTSRDECIERIQADKTRTNTDQIIEVVEKWFSKQGE